MYTAMRTTDVDLNSLGRSGCCPHLVDDHEVDTFCFKGFCCTVLAVSGEPLCNRVCVQRVVLLHVEKPLCSLACPFYYPVTGHFTEEYLVEEAGLHVSSA